MTFKLRKLSHGLGAEVCDIDVTAPMSESAFGEIHRAFLDYGVLLFRNQQFTTEEQVAYSKRFGKLEHNLRDDNAFVAPLGNLDADGKLRERMGRNGKEYIKRNYRWDVIMSKYDRLIGALRK